MNKRGFTLIELIIVITIISILASVAIPARGNTERARRAQYNANIKNFHTAAVLMDSTDENYSIPANGEIDNAFRQEALRISGVAEKEKDFEHLNLFTAFKDDNGDVCAKLTVDGQIYDYPVKCASGENTGDEIQAEKPNCDVDYLLSQGYILAEDEDFKVNTKRYIGTGEKIIIPKTIHGEIITDYQGMFSGDYSNLKAIATQDSSNVADMSYVFINGNFGEELDLTCFDTSSATTMNGMFFGAQVTTLDLINFNTSNVVDMSYMFDSSQATTINVSSFNTSNVYVMNWMFGNSQVLILDLSNFEAREDIFGTDTQSMFSGAKITHVDLSNFDLSNGLISDMFRESRIKTIIYREESDKNKIKSDYYFPAHSVEWIKAN